MSLLPKEDKPSIWMVTCARCQFEYGSWRPRCPPCGLEAPPLPEAKPKPEAKRKARKPRERKLSKSACSFCTLRGAKTTCKTCGALLHRGCASLHTCKEE